MRDRFPVSPEHVDDDYWHKVPQDSFSRELDSRVQASEMPYGYSEDPPSADTGDFNMRARQSQKSHKPKRD